MTVDNASHSVKGLRYINVWKYYEGKPVVKGVNMEVRPGEVTVLLGPNGSGKSTLFKMSIALVRPEKGEVRLDGINVAKDPVTARRVVGYVPEEPVLYESLEVTEYLSFILSIYGVSVSEDRFNAVLKVLGLEEHKGKLIGELSHGGKRKVALAAVMLRNPNVLVLDEVFSGLDVVSARAVKTWIRDKVAEGAAVLLSTHILPIAEAVADRVIIIYEGVIKAEGRPEDLRSLGSGLEEVYLKLTGYTGEIEKLVKALAGA